MIGIFSQTAPIQVEDYNTYIPTTYIKFVERAGARAVPILYSKFSDNQLVELLSHLNGVLFTGGDMELTYDDGSLTEYSRKGKLILDTIKEYNDKGIYYPVWAICLGFQMISVIEAPYPDVLVKGVFKSVNIADNVAFVINPRKTKLFRDMPEHLIHAMQEEKIIFYYHISGVYPETYTMYPGLQEYTDIAHSVDLEGRIYVAVIEHKKYPIFGVQFHPEKVLFTWAAGLNVPHTLNAVEMSQYFSNFFVKEAKKNFNKFNNDKVETAARIENYKLYYNSTTGMECYLFKE